MRSHSDDSSANAEGTTTAAIKTISSDFTVLRIGLHRPRQREVAFEVYAAGIGGLSVVG
jgi:hypothetical protein